MLAAGPKRVTLIGPAAPREVPGLTAVRQALPEAEARGPRQGVTPLSRAGGDQLYEQ